MSAKRQIFVVGNGMTKFEKPGSRDEFDYPDMAKEAVNNALKDAKINYGEIQQACVGYCYGDTTCGQRALYEVGMTGIPIFNVNNACSTGSTALFMARQLVEGGLADCVLALGFEKMEKGSLTPKFMDRTNPMEKHVEVMASVFELESAPFTAQMFGNAGKEHMKKYGTKPEHFAKIAWKNHLHSVNNPYSQFQDQYSMDQILNSPMVHEPLTKLQCCPTSDGAAAAIVCSAAFVEKHGLQDQAIEIVAQEMATDLPSTFNEGSCMKVVGYDMTKTAADRLYRGAGVKPTDIDVVELHDCFSTNELISYEALGLCEPGEAGSMVDRGDNTYGGKYVINPSGGLISKGHPLGATGLAQCAELCWQLKGQAGKRQVKGAKLALQHNIGLGGAVVVTLYRLGFPEAASGSLRVVTSPAADMSPEGFRAAPIFNLIQEALMKDGANIVKKVNAVYLFKITEGPNGSEGLWTVDVKNGSGSVKIGGDGAKPNVTLTISDSDFVELAEGRLKPQVAFFQKKLKLAGNMVLAMKLNSVLPPAGTAVSVTQTPANEGFKSSSIFKEVEERLRRDGDKIVGKVKGIYLFKVTGGPAGKDAMWLVDVKNGKGAVKSGPGKADCTITISDEDLLKVASGKLSAQTAFFSKKLKIAGNMGLAMKLKEVLPTPGQAKL